MSDLDDVAARLARLEQRLDPMFKDYDAHVAARKNMVQSPFDAPASAALEPGSAPIVPGGPVVTPALRAEIFAPLNKGPEATRRDAEAAEERTRVATEDARKREAEAKERGDTETQRNERAAQDEQRRLQQEAADANQTRSAETGPGPTGSVQHDAERSMMQPQPQVPGAPVQPLDASTRRAAVEAGTGSDGRPGAITQAPPGPRGPNPSGV